MTDEHKPLPVAGYTGQSKERVDLVNYNKQLEENILRHLDSLRAETAFDQRWLQIGRTHIEEAFMAINRAVFKPQRVKLPGDV